MRNSKALSLITKKKAYEFGLRLMRGEHTNIDVEICTCIGAPM